MGKGANKLKEFHLGLNVIHEIDVQSDNIVSS
jgi:hypothetical protein